MHPVHDNACAYHHSLRATATSTTSLTGAEFQRRSRLLANSANDRATSTTMSGTGCLTYGTGADCRALPQDDCKVEFCIMQVRS